MHLKLQLEGSPRPEFHVCPGRRMERRLGCDQRPSWCCIRPGLRLIQGLPE